MNKHRHQFIEKYDGLVGFGFDRQTDEATLTWYLQKFSDDSHMAMIRERMSDEDLAELFNSLSALLHKHLNEGRVSQNFSEGSGVRWSRGD